MGNSLSDSVDLLIPFFGKFKPQKTKFLKTPFELSRWRGGCYACDTLDIMDCRKVVNRLSPLFTNSLSINLLQAKAN